MIMKVLLLDLFPKVIIPQNRKTLWHIIMRLFFQVFLFLSNGGFQEKSSHKQFS